MGIVIKVATVLTIIGGLNWGLVGLFDWNLVDAIFGSGSAVSRIIYVLVGISAIITIFTLTQRRTRRPVTR